MSDAWLISGDSYAGGLNLLDLQNYAILGDMLSLAGKMVPGGIDFGAVERGPGGAAQASANATGLRQLTIGLLVLGSSQDEVELNWNAIQLFLEQARRAAGPYGQGPRCAFLYRRGNASQAVYYDVVSGLWPPYWDALPDNSGYKFGQLRLDCLPYARGAPIVDAVSATLANGSTSSVLYRQAVPGTVEALCHTLLTDASTAGLSGPPSGLSLSATSGTLAAGTYGYRVAARNYGTYGALWGSTLACTEVQSTLVSTGGVSLSWTALAGAVLYDVYGRTPGGELYLGSTSSTSFTDSGSLTPSGALPSSDTTTPTIVRATFGRRSGLPQPQGQFQGIYKLAALTPGTSTTDSGLNYTGSGFSRITGGTAWQNLASCVEPAGSWQHGLYSLKLRVRDSSTPLGQVSAVSGVAAGTGGNLQEGLYSAYVTTTDGTNESLPVALPTLSVPITQTAFVDDFESGDINRWDGQYFYAAQQNQSGANAIPDPSAAYTLGLPSSYGLLCTAENAMGSWLFKAIPGVANTGAVRFKLQLVSNSDSTTVGLPLFGEASATPDLPVVLLGTTGAGFTLQTYNPVTFAITGIGNPLPIPLGTWITFECVATFNSGTSSWQFQVYVDDVLVENFSQTGFTQAPATAIVGAYTPNSNGFPGGGSAGAAAIKAFIDNVQVSNAHIGPNQGQAAWTWTPATVTGTGYNVYFQRNGGSWRKVFVSGLSTSGYTLTSNTAGSIVTGPPTSAPAVGNALFRVGVAENASSPVLVWSRSVSTQVANGYWETLRLPPVPLPPRVLQQTESAQPTWVLVVQGKSGGTNTPTLDADCCWAFPHDPAEDLCAVVVPGYTLMQPAQFRIDTRWDEQTSADLVDAATGLTVIGQAHTRGRWRLGPGDNTVVVEAECMAPVAGLPPISDVRSCAFTTQTTLTPRFDQGRGAS